MQLTCQSLTSVYDSETLTRVTVSFGTGFAFAGNLERAEVQNVGLNSQPKSNLGTRAVLDITRVETARSCGVGGSFDNVAQSLRALCGQLIGSSDCTWAACLA